MSEEKITLQYQVIKRLFDKQFYANQVPAFKPNHIQYLKAGHLEGRPPNILFSPNYYRSKYLNNDPNFEPLAHYIQVGDKQNYNPHPLFDNSFYKKKVQNINQDSTALEHYLEIGWKNNLSPSPYFDLHYYLSQLQTKPSIPAVCHYLTIGENQGIDPNQYFLVKHFEKAANPKNWHYLAYNHLAKLDLFILEENGLLNKMGLKPLLNIEIEKKSKTLLKRIFDDSFYALSNPKLLDNKIELLQHYIDFGSAEGKFPHPLFNPDYYRAQNLNSENTVEPLLDYIKRGNDKISPHPLFDIDYYLSQLPANTEWEKTWLEHYLEIGWKENISPSPFFNVQFYLEKYPFVKEKQTNPFIHYLKSGESLGYQPDFDFYPKKAWRPKKPANISKGAYQQASKLEIRARGIYEAIIGKLVNFKSAIDTLPLESLKIVFVSHDASRTGAPLIVLKLAQQLKELFNIAPIFIIGLEGELVAEFKEIGPTYTFKDWAVKENPDTLNEMGRVMDLVSKLDVFGFLLNSAESRIFSTHIARQKKPAVFLIHEMGQAYEKGTFGSLGQQMDKLIFPSETVKQQAYLNSEIPKEKCMVLGQGLLKPHLLIDNKKRSTYKAKLKKAFGLAENTFIVLGCGSINKRKGVDLWLQTAIAVKATRRKRAYLFYVDRRTT